MGLAISVDAGGIGCTVAKLGLGLGQIERRYRSAINLLRVLSMSLRVLPVSANGVCDCVCTSVLSLLSALWLGLGSLSVALLALAVLCTQVVL